MKGIVFNNNIKAGSIEKDNSGNYIFKYDDAYFENTKRASISLTLPTTKQIYSSEKLFSFFLGLLSEGINKEIQCQLNKIDEQDDFTRLLLTTSEDTIGAITIKPENDELLRMLY